MTKDEALKLALEALETLMIERESIYDKAIIAIKETLAQPEQEPVAWVSTTELLVMRGNALGGAKDWRINLGLVKQDGDVGLYTTPPQRTWVGLTDEEKKDFWTADEMTQKEWDELFADIEAKLRSKNT